MNEDYLNLTRKKNIILARRYKNDLHRNLKNHINVCFPINITNGVRLTLDSIYTNTTSCVIYKICW